MWFKHLQARCCVDGRRLTYRSSVIKLGHGIKHAALRGIPIVVVTGSTKRDETVAEAVESTWSKRRSAQRKKRKI